MKSYVSNQFTLMLDAHPLHPEKCDEGARVQRYHHAVTSAIHRAYTARRQQTQATHEHINPEALPLVIPASNAGR
jgi:hypothetical protein